MSMNEGLNICKVVNSPSYSIDNPQQILHYLSVESNKLILKFLHASVKSQTPRHP